MAFIEFDPDYTYADRDGDKWVYVDGKWECPRTNAVMPDGMRPFHRYGPYTQIAKKDQHDQ